MNGFLEFLENQRLNLWRTLREKPQVFMLAFATLAGAILAIKGLPSGDYVIPIVNITMDWPLFILISYGIFNVLLWIPHYVDSRKKTTVYVEFENGFETLIVELERLSHSDRNIKLFRLCPYEFNEELVGSNRRLRRLVSRYQSAIRDFIREANLDDYTIYGLPKDPGKIEALLNDIRKLYSTDSDSSSRKVDSLKETSLAWSPVVHDFWLFVFYDSSKDAYESSFLFEITDQGERPSKGIFSTNEREVTLAREIFNAFYENLPYIHNAVLPERRKSIGKEVINSGYGPAGIVASAMAAHLREFKGEFYSIGEQEDSFVVNREENDWGAGYVSLQVFSDSNRISRALTLSDFFTDNLKEAQDALGNATQCSLTVKDKTIVIEPISGEKSQPDDTDDGQEETVPSE